MASIDQQFIEYIVKTLVSHPDAVVVQRDIDEKGVLLSLTVDPEDLGRVIGRRGVTAQSLRTLLRALGTKNDARYNLKIVNNDDYVPNSDSGRDSKRGRNSEESEEPVETVEEETDEVVENDEDSSELAEKTRQELADLDDLDI